MYLALVGQQLTVLLCSLLPRYLNVLNSNLEIIQMYSNQSTFCFRPLSGAEARRQESRNLQSNSNQDKEEEEQNYLPIFKRLTM